MKRVWTEYPGIIVNLVVMALCLHSKISLFGRDVSRALEDKVP